VPHLVIHNLLEYRVQPCIKRTEDHLFALALVEEVDSLDPFGWMLQLPRLLQRQGSSIHNIHEPFGFGPANAASYDLPRGHFHFHFTRPEDIFYLYLGLRCRATG
jgi:hypothetical protein